MHENNIKRMQYAKLRRCNEYTLPKWTGDQNAILAVVSRAILMIQIQKQGKMRGPKKIQLTPSSQWHLLPYQILYSEYIELTHTGWLLVI